ncbi:Ferredoxin [Halogranum amylolyticum]|uniref:Ferredoxin n=1 Tax=Halogranum amylolyticum TaxID=660520 RepID=A0A1H8SF60_9EURY|nr:ferredoxin Fer [Halogranum amylolyticum]SEO77215.1 Ferredoxin [Halogranum amylolyticum]
MDSPFEILGIESDADDDEVVRAYRKRVKEAHPDQGGSTREFLLVQTAYEKIQDGHADEPLEIERADRANDDTASRNGHDPAHEATNGAGGADDADHEDEDDEQEEGYRVEYLNYETLADHGWDLGDDDLFEKAADANLDPEDYGQLSFTSDKNLLAAAEKCGYPWPYACRGGACANCAIAVVEGEVEMPSNHILSQEMVDRGLRLSCISVPKTDELKIIYNVKSLPGLEELRLPAQQFDKARSND